MPERVIKASGVIGWSVLENLIPRIDAATDEGLVAVVDFTDCTGITSFACRQILKRSNNKEDVKLKNMSSGVKAAMDLHASILKEEAA